ncbi:MAG: ArsA family ATPase [Halanaerobiales bacterium]|nr:ArsA family ATPase [Halanaerobiales bacterium]
MDNKQYIFFSGKGGVGKTSMAAATAVYQARAGKKTLIVTTDPASNLSDVFQQKIGHQETMINGISNLFAMEIDPDRATEEYRERIIGPMREVMPESVIKVVEEQFNSPCTTEIAAFDRFVDFMGENDYDLIVFDTAPTGHTIRLLELPVDWSKHIEESAKGGGQTCMGPVEAIQSSKEKYDRATTLLRNQSKTGFVFVVQPEETPISEAERSANELSKIGIEPALLIVNGILPPEECKHPFFAKRKEMQDKHLKKIKEKFMIDKLYMELLSDEIKGIETLEDVGQSLYENKKEAYV